WGSLNARETSDFDTPAAAATSRIVGLDPEARGSSPTADPMASSSHRSSCGVYRRWLFSGGGGEFPEFLLTHDPNHTRFALIPFLTCPKRWTRSDELRLGPVQNGEARRSKEYGVRNDAQRIADRRDVAGPSLRQRPAHRCGVALRWAHRRTGAGRRWRRCRGRCSIRLARRRDL